MQRFLAAPEAASENASFRAIVAVFPDLGHDVERRVVDAHRRLKPTFLAQRLMLGEFYPSCAKPGLRNPDFRPLVAPWPLLVIRPMVEADVEFLLDADSFVVAYLEAYGRRGVARLANVLQARGPSIGTERVREIERLMPRI
jgi:hypothetical protein